jgi:hypothetical protein
MFIQRLSGAIDIWSVCCLLTESLQLYAGPEGRGSRAQLRIPDLLDSGRAGGCRSIRRNPLCE